MLGFQSLVPIPKGLFTIFPAKSFSGLCLISYSGIHLLLSFDLPSNFGFHKLSPHKNVSSVGTTLNRGRDLLIHFFLFISSQSI